MCNYNIISSGSSGNAILLENGILLDCGIPFKKIEPCINKLKLVFISHRHSDHLNLSTVRKLHELRPTIRFCVGEFLYQELSSAGINKKNIDVIKHNKIYDYKILKVSPFILIHDVKNFGLRIFDTKTNEKIFYAVDTSTLDHLSAKNYDCYLIEANYDDEILEANLKRDLEASGFSYNSRVKETHLSLAQASQFIFDNAGDNSKYEFIHGSKRNL